MQDWSECGSGKCGGKMVKKIIGLKVEIPFVGKEEKENSFGDVLFNAENFVYVDDWECRLQNAEV